MSTPEKSPAEAKANALVRRRDQIAWVALVIYGLTFTEHIPYVRSSWPHLAEFLFWCQPIGALPLAALFTWAGRCPVCGRWFSVGARTCAKCGHDFTLK